LAGTIGFLAGALDDAFGFCFRHSVEDELLWDYYGKTTLTEASPYNLKMVNLVIVNRADIKLNKSQDLRGIVEALARSHLEW
jgi:hypothetical protein